MFNTAVRAGDTALSWTKQAHSSGVSPSSRGEEEVRDKLIYLSCLSGTGRFLDDNKS